MESTSGSRVRRNGGIKQRGAKQSINANLIFGEITLLFVDILMKQDPL